MLLAAGLDHRQHRFDETVAGCALRSERELPPYHRMTQRTLARIVRRLDPFVSKTSTTTGDAGTRSPAVDHGQFPDLMPKRFRVASRELRPAAAAFGRFQRLHVVGCGRACGCCELGGSEEFWVFSASSSFKLVSIRPSNIFTKARTAGVISASRSGGIVMDLMFEDDIVHVVLENRVHVQINSSHKTPPGRERLWKPKRLADAITPLDSPSQNLDGLRSEQEFTVLLCLIPAIKNETVLQLAFTLGNLRQILRMWVWRIKKMWSSSRVPSSAPLKPQFSPSNSSNRSRGVAYLLSSSSSSGRYTATFMWSILVRSSCMSLTLVFKSSKSSGFRQLNSLLR